MRIIASICCISLFAFSPLAAQNQDSLAIRKYYEENAILWPGWTKYIKGNKSFPLRNLKEEIIYSPEAIHELSLYRKNRAYLEITMIASTGLLISAILVQDQKVKLGLLTGSLITASISIPLSFNTSAHLSRAIWLHNRDILLK